MEPEDNPCLPCKADVFSANHRPAGCLPFCSPRPWVRTSSQLLLSGAEPAIYTTEPSSSLHKHSKMEDRASDHCGDLSSPSYFNFALSMFVFLSVHESFWLILVLDSSSSVYWSHTSRSTTALYPDARPKASPPTSSCSAPHPAPAPSPTYLRYLQVREI